MFWARSLLFWKIVGLYALLTLVAVSGLLIALNVQFDQQAEQLHRDEALALVGTLSQALDSAQDRQALLDRWQGDLLHLDIRTWLMDDALGSVVPVTEEMPDHPVVRACVRTALRGGEAIRWLPAGDRDDGRLVVARRYSPVTGPALVLLMISSSERYRDEAAERIRAATRAAAVTWLAGLICVTLISAGLVRPLRIIRENLGATVERTRRQDLLLRVSDRKDELGDVAQGFRMLDGDRTERIAALEQSERVSRANSDLLSAVLDSMVEGVIAIDPQERILFLNAAARRLLGMSAAMQAGHRIYEAVRVPALLETVRDALLTRELQSLEFRITRSGLSLAMVVNPIRKESYPGAVAVIRDVSNLRQLESMRRDFISGVSHELKTPLTVIQACTDTLLNGALDDREAALHFLTQIDQQADRLLQLILRMLQLARVESGEEVFQREPVDIDQVADVVLASFRPVADSLGVALVRDGASHLRVSADPQALRTVISNLVDNALKHTPAGGTVSVQLCEEATGRSVIVRDTGVGIPQEHLGRIFERFYRVNRDRSRDRGGSGLGLAIVKHLCQTMDAEIHVQSSPGRGTEFRVTFPPESPGEND